MLLYTAEIKVTHCIIFKKVLKFNNLKEKSLTSFLVVMLRVRELTCTSTSRVLDVSDTSRHFQGCSWGIG